MSVTIETGHVQTPFKTASGKQVQVDEGLMEVLTSLRDLGVETLYSCEGRKPHGGYILADGRSMTKLLLKMYYLHKRGRYSRRIAWLAERFILGTKEFEYGKFKVYTRKGDGCKSVQMAKMRRVQFQGVYANGYKIEQMYSKHYGWRLSIRWYKTEDLQHIEELLKETKELL